ncbi:MAG: histidine kinase, partial [Acidimicrobiia bacterium]|nr:histidine kinase [Acidimicrobiia bacterium]
WKWVGWWSVSAIALASTATAFAQSPWSTLPINSGGYTVPGILGLLNDAGFTLAAIAAVVSVASLVVRYRRSMGVARSQIRWIALGGGIYVLALIVGGNFSGPPAYEALGGLFAQSALVASYGIAITRFRLYDIDLVISRTLTYGVLAAFITGVYVLLVVGIGTLLGIGKEPNLALSIAAVAIVAVAFEPLRNRVQHAANRLVFGHRASPYEVLAQATLRLADTGTPEETLAEVTHLVAEGTGAVSTVFWVRVGEHLQPQSATPAEALSGLGPVPVLGGTMPEIPGEAVIQVLHRQELLGALTITKPRGQSVTVADEKVLADVAAGSGLLLRNIGLNVELAERAEQLRVSRRRLVAAQDAERHRLERDLHDGAQQQVVALKVKLGIARTLAEREGADQVVAIVTDLAATTQEAVEAMRAVAHGIYPPLLSSEGLPAALAARLRTFPATIDVSFESVGRYERSFEESVYFCVVELLVRAIDGGASAISVSLVGLANSIELILRHDGEIGDLVAIEDRVHALEGHVQDGTDAQAGFVSAVFPTAGEVLETA